MVIFVNFKTQIQYNQSDMQNKLQELTEKLYQEGLVKGKEEGEALLAQARKEAADIVAKAEKKAAAINAKKAAALGIPVKRRGRAPTSA